MHLEFYRYPRTCVSEFGVRGGCSTIEPIESITIKYMYIQIGCVGLST